MAPGCLGAARKPRYGKPRWEVADVFRRYGGDYRLSRRLPASQRRVMRAVETCRTAYLGGHLERCGCCGFERHAYNSCRDRHCPKCQSLAKARWLEARTAELLPVGYFHNVFTLPHELNPVALCNKRIVFNILFKAVAGTLRAFALDPRRGLGGKLGFLAILHTWDQKLLDHTHLHCLIPAGALARDGSRWIDARPNFLFPVKALAKVFRGKFLDLLKEAFSDGRLRFPSQTAALGSKDGFVRLIRRLAGKDWVVYSKAPFGGPEKTLDYLGRYTHRVAIANHRIIAVEDGLVRFQYRDGRDGNKRKVMTLKADEFIRRFLLHTLPRGYMRVRSFGFLANRSKGRDLERCRELLGVSREQEDGANAKTVEERMLQLTGVDLAKCPQCGKRSMAVIAELPKAALASSLTPAARPAIFDSS